MAGKRREKQDIGKPGDMPQRSPAVMAGKS